MGERRGGVCAVAVCAALVVLFVLVLPLLVLSVLLSGASASASGSGVVNVPSEYVGDVQRAGSVCRPVTGPLIAAQIEVESNWNPRASSPSGAQGIAQFMPATWAAVGMAASGQGRPDVWNPHDSIWTQGNYMCSLAAQVDALKGAGTASGDTVELSLAAYNAGIGSVRAARGMPADGGTRAYVRRILALVPKYTAPSGSSGGETGQLTPPLVMLADGRHIDIADTYYGGPSGYPPRQCTWWAANRRATIGRPVDAHMGNGGFWVEGARRLGYQFGRSPRLGAAMSISNGALGSDAYYGHVAIVERIEANGAVVVSESGASMSAPALRTFSPAQLQTNASSIWYIY